MVLTLEQAYRALGLELGEDKKKARRAYLKLLKKHKPESDPEGFQRIRTAWERIKNAGEWELSLPAVSNGQNSDDVPNATEPPTAGSPKAQIDALYTLAEGKSEEERLALAMEALEADPTQADLRWLVYDCLIACQKVEQAVNSLRDWLPEDPGFLDQLILVHGDACTAEELAQAVGGGVPIMQIIWVHLGRDEDEIAERLFRDALKQAREDPASMMHFDAIQILLRLLVRPEVRVLSLEYITWLKATGRERSLDDHARAELALFEELLALLPTFPETLKSALTEALMVGDPAQATPAFAAWRTRASRREIKTVKAQMREHAPLFLNACWLSTEAPKPATSKKVGTKPATSKKVGNWVSGWSGLAAVVCLHLLFRMCNTHSASDFSQQTVNLLEQGQRRQEAQRQASVARAAITDAPCDLFGPNSDGCRQVNLVADYAESHRCIDMEERLLELEAWWFGQISEVECGVIDPRVETVFMSLRRQVIYDCPDIVDFHYIFETRGLFETRGPESADPGAAAPEQEPQ